MAARFIAGINLGQDAQALQRRLADEGGRIVSIDLAGLFVCAGPETPQVRLNGGGIVIGSLYRRDASERVTTLDPDICDEIVRSRGRHLIEHYWGDFVALIAERGGVCLLRSPFGNLPCLYRTGQGTACIASDIDFLKLGSGTANSIDYLEVGDQLFVGDMRSNRTCLTGVREVRGGDVVCFSGMATATDRLWSPWSIDQRSEGSALNEADAQQLRETAITCVAARTGTIQKPLLMLSGGLDSSIVAACLAARGRSFDCLNLVAPAAAGDERAYARAVSEYAARDLYERSMPDAALDLRALPASRLPRPVARGFEQRLYQEAAATAAEFGCDAVLDGGGGDNVFCSLQSASPAADCLLAGSGLSTFWRTCREIGDMAQASVWRVAWRALLRAGRRFRPYRWETNDSFLSPAAAQAANERALHPWLARNSSGMPGRAGQIALLVAAQSFIEDGPAGTKERVISPLVSQPLIEHCLSIPSWRWFEHGCNRAIARRAFERQLPQQVAWRRSKGIPDSFIVRLFEANRSYIRDNLAGGLLAREGVIDAAAVLKVIDDPTPFKGREFSRIVRLMDAEKWAKEIRES